MNRATMLVLTVAFLVLVGCAPADPEPTVVPTATPSASEIAGRAGKRMLAIDSLHFLLELSGRLTYLDSPPTLALKEAEGDLVRPDRVRALVKMSSFGVISEVGIIGIGAEQYVTNPLNQAWQEMPAEQGWYFEPTILFHPEYGIEAILEDTAWTLGTADESEAGTYQLLQGLVPGERISPLTFGMVTSGQVSIAVWVHRTEDYVYRIEMVEMDSDPENPTRWVIELSAFDVPVGIQTPPGLP